MTDKIIKITPCKIPFTYPPFGERKQCLQTDVDGIQIHELSISQPEIDFNPPFLVIDGNVVGEYPYLKVVPVSQKIENLKSYWLKLTTHIPMI